MIHLGLKDLEDGLRAQADMLLVLPDGDLRNVPIPESIVKHARGKKTIVAILVVG